MNADLPEIIRELLAAVSAQTAATKRLARRVGRLPQGQRYLTAKDVARLLGFKTAASVWDMPEVMAERIYPCNSTTPRWSLEGLARAEARMPHEPRFDAATRARKARKAGKAA